MSHLLLLALALHPPAAPAPADTLRLEVGAAEIDGRIMRPHFARNRVYRDGTAPVAHWTNQLTLGDSAGIPVMRWVTRGQQGPPGSDAPTWELLQTYDARTLAPLAYARSASNGSYLRLRFEDGRVHGVRRTAGGEEQVVDQRLERMGFMASASDLVPYAAGLRAGLVIAAPIWGPGMTGAEDRIFSVLAEETVQVEGESVVAWRVEERRAADGAWIATWWLNDRSPYMVAAEVALPDGAVQRMTGVDLGTPPPS